MVVSSAIFFIILSSADENIGDKATAAPPEVAERNTYFDRRYRGVLSRGYLRGDRRHRSLRCDRSLVGSPMSSCALPISNMAFASEYLLPASTASAMKPPKPQEDSPQERHNQRLSELSVSCHFPEKAIINDTRPPA